MALSAVKSTSKRENSSSSSSSSKSMSSSEKKMPNRRSRSVSAAISRCDSTVPPPSSSNVSLAEEFLNKMDNPLFCCSSSSSPDSGISPGASVEASGIRRGRLASRSSGFGGQIPSSRSLSRVGIGRRLRSVSRDRYGNPESGVEHGCRSASSSRNAENDGKFVSSVHRKSDAIADGFDVSEHADNLQTWNSRHLISKPWDASNTCAQSQNWEDRISTCSFSEAEEGTIRAVCDQMKTSRDNHPLDDSDAGGIYETVRSEVRRAVSEIRNDIEKAIRRKNSATITTENTADMTPELVNSNAVDLVSDITWEYTTKLEQSQERARKLRADLAVEEQRGQELSRMLKEILPASRVSDSRKSHPRRKGSIERLRMSRRLAEEAMNYFDECVSISTLDSDFSSAEEPQRNSVIGIPSMGSSRFFSAEESIVSDFLTGHVGHHEELDNQTQCSLSIAGSDFAISSRCSGGQTANHMHRNGNHDLEDSDTPRSGKFRFSFAHEPTVETVGVHDLKQYIEIFEKKSKNESAECPKVRSSYSPDDCNLSIPSEGLLLDSVILRNRIESGGMLICDIRTF